MLILYMNYHKYLKYNNQLGGGDFNECGAIANVSRENFPDEIEVLIMFGDTTHKSLKQMMDNLNLNQPSIDSFINNKIGKIKQDKDVYTTSSKIIAPLRIEFTTSDTLVLHDFFKAFIYRYFSIFKLHIRMPNVGKDKLSPSEAHDVTYAFDSKRLLLMLEESKFNPSDYYNIRQDYYNIIKKYSFINLLLIFFLIK